MAISLQCPLKRTVCRGYKLRKEKNSNKTRHSYTSVSQRR